MYICDVSIYIYVCVCFNFVSSWLISSFMLFLIKKKTMHMRKESESQHSLSCFYWIFIWIIAYQSKFFFITIGLHWKKKKKGFFFFFLSDGAETQVNELENCVASCPWGSSAPMLLAVMLPLCSLFTSWLESIRRAQPLQHSGLITNQKKKKSPVGWAGWGRGCTHLYPLCDHSTVTAFSVCSRCAVCRHA